MTTRCERLNPAEEKPLVTVALPVLNGGKLLKIAVASILAQSWENFELLVIDDGSSDGAVTEIEALADPRLRVLRDGSSRGLAVRLNEAIRVANGKYFARMDHDDVSHPERLARQVMFLEENAQVDLVGTGCVTIDELGNVTGALPLRETHSSICSRPWLGFYMPHPTWMGRTSWFARNRYTEPAAFRCEDQQLLLRTYSSSQFHVLEERLLAYRLRERTKITTLLKTRFSLGNIQLKFFMEERKYHFMILCIFSAISRVFLDFLKKWHIFSLSSGENIEEVIFWESYTDYLICKYSLGEDKNVQ